MTFKITFSILCPVHLISDHNSMKNMEMENYKPSDL